MNKCITIFLLTFSAFLAEAQTLSVPEAIQPPLAQHSALSLHAQGEQLYQCTVAAGVYAWEFVKPEAKLYRQQQLIGTHSQGPSWRDNTGGYVKAKLLAEIADPKAASIPWLLLKVVKQQGHGLLSTTSYINRVNTVGGLKPITGCDSNHLGLVKGVSYSADYIFYQPNHD